MAKGYVTTTKKVDANRRIRLDNVTLKQAGVEPGDDVEVMIKKAEDESLADRIDREIRNLKDQPVTPDTTRQLACLKYAKAIIRGEHSPPTEYFT